MKKKDYLKIIKLFIVGCILIAVCVSSQTVKQWRNVVEVKTEQEPIINRFPKLVGIKECYWTGDVIGKGRDALGPSSYWMRGYLKLEHDEADKIENEFDWEPVDGKWHPSIDVPQVGNISGQWYCSEGYNEYILSYNNFGSFYYNEEHDMIFFDIQR